VAVSDVAFETLKDRVTLVERQFAVKTATDEAIEHRLTKIETVLSRLTWLMVTGIGGAAIAFIVSGGLNLTSPAMAAVGGF
jgi:hypothetical protein